MSNMQILGHGCYIGHTGYNEHTRMFFRALSGKLPVRVRNYTHIPDQSYLDELDHQILIEQAWNIPPYKAGRPYQLEGNPINIVLAEADHHYFYDNYRRPRIAYNVWESTRYPDHFFSKLLEFDELWTASNWQQNCAIEQGYPADRVRVVPEGVDSAIFHPDASATLPEYDDGRFKFLLFGRWEYRKATTEIIRTFLSTFRPDEAVDLVCSIDNPFSMIDQRGKTTEQYLDYCGLSDPRIKIKHFPPLADYVRYLQAGHVFVSCARGEGWNLPLIQAIACGIPTIASEHGGQLDFAAGVSHLVRTKELRPPEKVFDGPPQSGLFVEPDFEHLSEVMRHLYENYTEAKGCALESAPKVAEKFSWENAASIAAEALKEIDSDGTVLVSNRISVTFLDQAKVEISGSDKDAEYDVEFIDTSTNASIYRTSIKSGHWAAASPKYYVPWRVVVRESGIAKADRVLDLKGKRVLVRQHSLSLGDNIAWMPIIDAFRQKHQCQVTATCFFPELFKGQYPDITVVDGNTYPEGGDGFDVSYRIRLDENDLSWNKNTWRTISVQQAACDTLGLPPMDIQPSLARSSEGPEFDDPYICISEFSTWRAKQWHSVGWQDLVLKLKKQGYGVVSVSSEPTGLRFVTRMNGKPLASTVRTIQHAAAMVSVDTGPAWIAWSLGVPLVIVSGGTMPGTGLCAAPHIVNTNACHGCLNDPQYELERGNWNFCPEKKDFECVRGITVDMVWAALEPLLEAEVNLQVSAR